VDSWINPTSVVGGVLAVTAAAYLSAVYLVWDARRLNETDMAEYFRRRAVVSAVVVAVIAVAGAVVLRADAAYLFDGLTTRALPVVILSGACGAGALLLLVRDATRGARALAVVAVAAAVIS
jgi:cytochrome bd ubiquinol oxidase subunit II